MQEYFIFASFQTVLKSNLLFWFSVQFELVNYGETFYSYGSSPIWAAIRLRENEVEKLKVYMCSLLMNKRNFIIFFLSDLFPWDIICLFRDDEI